VISNEDDWAAEDRGRLAPYRPPPLRWTATNRDGLIWHLVRADGSIVGAAFKAPGLWRSWRSVRPGEPRERAWYCLSEAARHLESCA
jgi:hypothetical protein